MKNPSPSLRKDFQLMLQTVPPSTPGPPRAGRSSADKLPWGKIPKTSSLLRLRLQQAPGPVLLVVVAAGYFALAQFVMLLNDPVNLGAGFWPAAGVSFALLMLVRPPRWGWVLAGVAVAEFGGDLAHGYPLASALFWTAGNCVEPLVGAVLLRRLGNRSGFLVPVRQFLRFIVAAVVVGPLTGASIGTLGTLLVTDGSGVWQIWPKYFVGDALGVLVIAPLLLRWKQRRIRRHPGETITLTLALLGVTFVSFRTWGDVWDSALPYLVIPLLMWAALRYGSRGAALGVFVTTQIANWFTSTGAGPFAYVGASSGHAITLLQIFLVIIAVSTLVMAGLVEDLVDRTEVEARLAEQASTDRLTGLPNRALLTSTLSEYITSGSRGVGVCVCDLDHFKVINDGLGHAAGDEVLVEVARRMRSSVRDGDLVARLGGDEFVVVMEGEGDDLEQVARRMISAVAVPMILSDGTTVTPSVSVGLAHSASGTEHSSLLRHADAALFRAKELGRGRFHRFDERLRLQVMDRLFIQTEAPKALADDSIYCVYQPEVVIESGALFSFEALSRWDHQTRGSIPPTRFVPIIEEIGMAGGLFDHVLAETLGAQAKWAEQLGFHPPVAVNASARQLGDTDLAVAVGRALARAGCPADSLWLEVTEGAVASPNASHSLRQLHDLGVRLAIDDFGTGWSSMERLATFPWDLLKIDRTFVKALGGPNKYAEQVVISTIALAHALGIPTTAEGVETPQQLERLAELGCDVAQGYLFARPLPAGQAISHVTPDGHWSGPATPGRPRDQNLRVS